MRGLISVVFFGGVLSGALFSAASAQETPPDFFADHSDLEFIIYTDLSVLFADRSLDSPERPAEVGYMGPNNTPVWLPVQVKTRGKFRLVEDVCEIPPLRLDFRARRLWGTVFQGQNQLKLVTHCQPDPEYEQYVVLEYLAYRLYELLSPKSFRARLAKVTYADASETVDPITGYAFLIEDIDDVAYRHGMVEVELDGFHPMMADAFEMGVHDVFQFMIGNTDWSTFLSQNVNFIQDVEGNTTVIPFDFDWAGVVSTPYTYPAPDIPIENVRERYFMGVCRVPDHLNGVFQYFVEKKEEIYDLYRNEQALAQHQRERVLAYFDEFYETITDERLADRHIRATCKM
jgi:hypothetical protein